MPDTCHVCGDAHLKIQKSKETKIDYYAGSPPFPPSPPPSLPSMPPELTTRTSAYDDVEQLEYDDNANEYAPLDFFFA